MHGQAFKPGERVFLLMNAANRDPRAYAAPDRLDLQRHGVPHLTFGFGAHICLGFPLARLEGQIALPARARALEDDRARRAAAGMDRLDGAARHEGDAAARATLSGEPDHLPRAPVVGAGRAHSRLGLQLDGDEGRAERGAALDLPHPVPGSGLGGAVRRAARRRPAARGAERAVGRGSALLAFLNITCWNMLIAFGVALIPSGPRVDSRLHHADLGDPALGVAAGRAHDAAKRLAVSALGHGRRLPCSWARACRGSARPRLGSLLVLGAAAQLGARHGAAEAPTCAHAAGSLHGVDHAPWRRADLHRRGAARRPARACAVSASRRRSAWPTTCFVAFAFAHWAWIKLATSVPVGVFSLSMLIIPVVGVLSGMVFLGERPSWTEVAALVLRAGRARYRHTTSTGMMRCRGIRPGFQSATASSRSAVARCPRNASTRGSSSSRREGSSARAPVCFESFSPFAFTATGTCR